MRACTLGAVIALSCLIGGATDATADETLLRSKFGEASGDKFGENIALVGDFNGDGYDDFVVGAREYPGGSDMGRAYVYFGGESPPDSLVLTGETAGDWFGNSVAGAGDVNDDTFDDIIIGAPMYDDSGTRQDVGRAYIFFGRETPIPTPDVVITGEQPGDQLGRQVSGAGRFDEDDYDDVVIGVPRSDESGADNAGAAYVLLGGDPPNTQIDFRILGESAADQLGSAVAGPIDLDGNDYDDFVLGVGHHDLGGAPSYFNQGRVYIVFGDETPDGTVGMTLDGDYASQGRFGHGVAAAGDVNGDTYDDLLVGAYFRGGYEVGRAYLFFGGPLLLDTERDLTLEGISGPNNRYSYFGFELTGLGDVNGDSFGDFAISAQNDSIANPAAGRVFFYLGGAPPDSTADLQLNGLLANQLYGHGLAPAGNQGDVIIGIPGILNNRGGIEVWDLDLPLLPPTSPSDLVATPVSDSEIELAWTQTSNNELGFKIYRSPALSELGDLIATQAANTVAHPDTGLDGNTTYYYRVYAYNDAGDSPGYAANHATTEESPPAAPTDLTANAVSNRQINLEWTDASYNELGFKIYRSGSALEEGDQIDAVGWGVQTYSDTNLVASTEYFYRVHSYNAAGRSIAYTDTFATTLVAPPDAPTDLTATAESSTIIRLAWTDIANNESNYEIRRSEEYGTGYQVIVQPAAGAQAYLDENLEPQTEYHYRVLAQNISGYSTAAEDSATTDDPPAQVPASPTGLDVDPLSSTRIRLSWTCPADNEDGFEILWGSDEQSVTTSAGTVAANVLEFIHEDLTPEEEYFYAVYAFNGTGPSVAAATGSGTTPAPPPEPPDPPIDFTCTALSGTRISLSWTDIAGNEDGYTIHRGDEADAIDQLVVELPAGTEGYTDVGRAPETTYWYSVQAHNSAGLSASVVNSATTGVNQSPQGELPSDLAGMAGLDLLITATLYDDEQVTSAWCHWRRGGETDFTAQEMTEGSAQEWSATIDGDELTWTGIQYYVVVHDAVASTTIPFGAPDEHRKSITVSLIDLDVFETEGRTYALLGMPFVPESDSPTAVFDELGAYDNDNWRYGTYDPDYDQNNHYREPTTGADDATPGSGFWLLTREDEVIAASGTSTFLGDYYEILLDPGWNMIGNPFAFAVATAAIIRPDGVANNFHTYDGTGYTSFSASLEARQGCWLYNGGDPGALLLIPPLGASGSKAISRPDMLAPEEPGWSVCVEAETTRRRDVGNRFGMRQQATDGSDETDFRDAPYPPGDHITLSLITEDGVRLLSDYRPLDGDGACWDLRLASNMNGAEYRLTFTPEGHFPIGWELVAISTHSLHEVDLNATRMMTGRVGEGAFAETWLIAAGTPAYVERIRHGVEEDLDEAASVFSMRPAFPNPFTGANGTVVALTLPSADKVSLSVFDMRGHLVKILHAGRLSRGLTRFAWYGRDAAGRRVAEGTYFLRVQTSEHDLTRKVLLLR